MKRSFLLGFLACLLAWAGPAMAQTTSFGTTAQQNGFGRALDIDGQHVFVGEPRNSHSPGRVYVFNQSDDGGWTETAYLEANDGSVGDYFGAALDGNGETLAVGAPSSNAVYVFTAGSDGWTQAARLTASDSTSGLGASVALSDGRLFVSTQNTVSVVDGDTTTAPAVHVFTQQNGEWRETTALRSSQLSAGAGFGESIVASSEHLLVSAPKRDGGAVVAFRRDGEEWSEVQTLSAGELGGSAQFGAALAWAGDHVLVGAPRAYDATGAAYTYAFDANANAWRSQGRLLPYDGASRHLFGAGLAYDGTDLWVGAPGAQNQTGALYRFQQRDSTWSSVRRLMHSEAESGNALGATLAANDRVVAAGLPGDDHGAGTLALYSLADSDWTQKSTIAPTTGKVLSSLTGEKRPCSDGSVKAFNCENVDLQSFLPISEIGGDRGIDLNDIWGWTDPQTGTEYALVGRTDGTSFVDVSNPTNPVYVGELPLTDGARINSWRDVKVYKNHAYVVADNAGDHGMQIFDLTRLRDVSPSEMPKTFEHDALYDQVNSVHNIVINEETGYAYAVGSSGGGKTCGGGLHMINIQDPLNPTFEGCFADKSTGRSGTGYTHDAQCVVYEGPDQEYRGREICIGANETAISVADVTNKDSAKAISTASYPDHAYVHQGWFTEDQRYFYQNDELDELQGKAEQTRTLVWDMKDLDNPKLVTEKMLPEESTDHNLYVKGDRMYQSNYKSGLRILDISNPTQPKEVAHFDTQPYGKNSPGFQGSWSNYPYFESGIIVVSSIGEGLFVLTPSRQEL
ncbi:choice-of-anchor B family protein [Salinibacter sp. 10B]|uniref:choice-of-anchor B family protein n=1 Tax=Salinibacter sp. 10B TaxID=1923971 RepID=UPI000CF4F817|nr:choice-of-anchor B family protein [Salinibacter sp. 10B]